MSSGGLKLITSMRNKFVGIGQRLECTLNLPYVGTVRTDVKVKHVNTTFYRNKQFLVMGAEFIKKDSILLRSLGDYLLNFAKEATVKSLNSEGFGLKNVSRWLDFSFVKSEEEYNQVLKLRYKTYKNIGKVSESTTVKDMADEFDSKASILVAKYNGEIIGSVAYMFPDGIGTTMMGRDVKYSDFGKLLKPTDVTEIWRFCIDNSFRKADITYDITARVVLAAIKNKRRFLFSSTTKNMLDFYKKIGFKETGVKYTNRPLKGIEHEVIIMDVYDAIIGKSVGIKYWNKLYKGSYKYLSNIDELDLSSSDYLRVWLYKNIGNILNYD